MYELGVRLSLTNKPGILIKQELADSKDPFDIAFFHREPYNPLQPRKIVLHIIKKIRQFEVGEDEFVSPIYNALQASPSVIMYFKQRSTMSILKGLVNGLEGTAENIRLFLEKTAKGHSQFTIPGKGSFAFRPRQFPGLSAYLTNFPLTDLLPERLTNEFDNLISSFYMKYYCSDLYWQTAQQSEFTHFISDSSQILDATPLITKAVLNCDKSDIVSNIEQELITLASQGV